MSGLGRVLDVQGYVVLDGGLATALEAAGHVLDTALWSARLLADAPEAILEAHLGYLEAGADCVTTASYQATPQGFHAAGFSAAEADRLLERSVRLAVEARSVFLETVSGDRTGACGPGQPAQRPRPLVAASVGPYGAFLADGSEYSGRYDIGRSGLAAFHRARLHLLAASGADILALETIPSLAEVEVLVELLEEIEGVRAWISFTCRDGAHLRDGTPVEAAAEACSNRPGVEALCVNCTDPRHVGELLRRIGRVTRGPMGAYPNSGEAYDTASRRWVGEGAGAGWLEHVPAWVAAGARIVGGCCRVGPDAIRQLRATLERSVLPGGRRRDS